VEAQGRRWWLALMEAQGRNLKRKPFQNKNWIFEFTGALEICTRRFRRNFDVEFFLISSRILKDFRKKKYNIPCHAMHPMQDDFWKDFYMHSKSICTSMLAKFYPCKKRVLQTYPPPPLEESRPQDSGSTRE
jgi:hypothetical protein